ncbi:AbrB family transcriptional regulator [Levilactobacillus lanxiensis]|uniref:AbrB family transcriptional regulator n=1 Tax=Levilactobacillus lanxiensis TaxID=2799568 RepID=A0ABW4D1U3_9LACO|nr:AbrB family transcriptional regulator [Levilactobacillus lanxiensis]
MIDPEMLNGPVKLFRNGNSYAFQLSKSDCEFFGVDGETVFEKIISPDGKKVTFRKVEQVRMTVLEAANGLFDEHEGLMKRLEDL